ncbi:hypothetical protein CHH80_22265 [Bacillus sp. 7504-2]|nr:hypothetical protein CHH80_22265 [Bacillus sp. 7504-2]
MVVLILENNTNSQGGLKVYKIKRGDTVCSIARELNIPIMSIFMVNKHRDPKQLTIGDTLCLPNHKDQC